MSWARDLDADLINLDHVQRVQVLPLAEAQGDATHALFAYLPILADGAEPDVILFIGTEQQCMEKREAIAKALHMVRF